MPTLPPCSMPLQRRTVFLMAGAAALLSACAAPASREPAALSVTDASGSRTTVPRNPAKTVVLDAAALDTLHALGVDGIAGVAQAPLPDFLAAYADDARYPKVGTLFEPDAAAIQALGPDLIIVGGRSADKREAMQAIAPTLDLNVPPGDLVPSVVANARLLASIYGKEDAAQPLLQRLEASARAVRQRMQGQGRGLVVLTTGGKIMALPPGPRFGAIYETFGVAPLPLEVEPGARGKQITPEFIRQQDPDWLFVIDRDASIGRTEAPARPARELLDEQPAVQQASRVWRNHRIIHLDPVNWYILGAAGVTSLQQSVDRVAAALG